MVLENRFIKSYEFSTIESRSSCQYEIRVYADIMLDTVKKWVPITYEAFMDYRVEEQKSIKRQNYFKKID